VRQGTRRRPTRGRRMAQAVWRVVGQGEAALVSAGEHMASSKVAEFWSSTWTQRGGRRPAVNKVIWCFSETSLHLARMLRKDSWYLSTYPVRRRWASSPSGLARSGGPKRRLTPAENSSQDGAAPRLFSQR
jgi:hypothetical protein